jgi:asparagine synthase (glutamine-hydrolysing)
MCGICGMVGRVDPDLLAAMMSILAHRGPDDAGLYLSPDGQVGLGNRRLAIIDLSPAGHMPMANRDETLWMTYNGEVYNFPELRAELEQRGYRFRSGTDTEAILYLYEEYGIEAFRRLNVGNLSWRATATASSRCTTLRPTGGCCLAPRSSRSCSTRT